MKNPFSFYRCSRLGLAAVLFTLLLPQTWAQQRDPIPNVYKLSPVYLPYAERPAVRYERQQLPFKQTGGDLPTYDGEQFQLNLMDQKLSSVDNANEIVSTFLRSLNSPLTLDKEMRLNVNATTAKADAKFVDEQIREGQESTQKRLSGSFKEVSKASTTMVEEFAEDVRKQASRTVTVFRYNQFLDDVRIDNTGLIAHAITDGNVVSVHGRFYNDVKPTNTGKLKAIDAQNMAMNALKKQYGLEKITAAKRIELVLLPYAEAFKYCWRTELTADGPYETWIDAETGQILQLLPDRKSVV